ncbi:MAG: YceI family protein [Alphaproteobacteria bacterium]|nr:YceI family protein [Alphaproteobacteria bacterium]
MDNKTDSYGFVLKFIHWTTALLIMGLLFAGLVMTDLPFSETKLKVYMLHKSFGLLVLALLAVRVFWKLLTPKVKPLDTHQTWEKVLAKITHVFLYFALFAMPLSGWIMSSAGEFPVSFFGLPVPALSAKDPGLFDVSREFHELLALALIVIVGLHLAGALKHHVIDRDRTMVRMMNSKNYNFLGGLAVGLLFAALLGVNFLLAAKGFLEEEGTPDAQTATISSQPAEASVSSAPAVANQWSIVKTDSRLGFEAMQYGQAFNGTFDFDGTIVFDPADLEGSSADISIDIASIKTGSDDRDAQAKSTEWFDAGKFPKARFVTEKFESTGANQYTAQGELTIRDVTLPVSFPFTLVIAKKENGQQTAEMNAELALKRLDFGVGQGQWKATETIADAVKISLLVHAERPQD